MLTLKINEAIFERDTAMLFDMDPAYQINWKDTKIESKKAYGGGTTPKWSESHELEVGTDMSSAGVITLAFKDDTKVICQTLIQVKQLVKGQKGVDIWFQCRHEGKVNGSFSMRVEYAGEAEGEEEEAEEEKAEETPAAP